MDAALELVNAITGCLANKSARDLPQLEEACRFVGDVLHIAPQRAAVDEIEGVLSDIHGRTLVVATLTDAMNDDPSLGQRCIRLIAGLTKGDAGDPPFLTLMLALSIVVAAAHARI